METFSWISKTNSFKSVNAAYSHSIFSDGSAVSSILSRVPDTTFKSILLSLITYWLINSIASINYLLWIPLFSPYSRYSSFRLSLCARKDFLSLIPILDNHNKAWILSMTSRLSTMIKKYLILVISRQALLNRNT